MRTFEDGAKTFGGSGTNFDYYCVKNTFTTNNKTKINDIDRNNIVGFIINKFSVKKKKDLINSQINKYNKLIQEIEVTRPRKKDADFTEELKENLENDLSEFMDLEK